MRTLAIGGRLAPERGREKDGVIKRMLCLLKFKNEAAKQRKQSPVPCAKSRKSRPVLLSFFSLLSWFARALGGQIYLSFIL